MNVLTQFPVTRDYDRDQCFRAMFEGAAIGIGICQLDGRILEANPALGKMLGYSQQELEGSNLSGDERSQDKRSLDEMMRGERESFEIEKRYQRKDGSELWGHL